MSFEKILCVILDVPFLFALPSPPSVETGTEGLGFAKFTRRKTLFNSAKGYVSLFNVTVLSFSFFSL